MGRSEARRTSSVSYTLAPKLKLIKANMMVSSTETGIMFGRVHCLREFKCHGANQEFVWPRRFGERECGETNGYKA